MSDRCYPLLPHSHILRATSRFHHWQGVGPLSIKSFENGRAYYRTEGGGTFAVDPGSYLILNHAQHYEITIESETPVDSFCVFFSPLMAETVLRSLTEQAAALLDDRCAEGRGGTAVEFLVRTHTRDAWVSPLLERLRRAGPELSLLRLEEETLQLLEAMLLVHRGVLAEAARLPVARWSTRAELYRRVRLAHEYIRACYAEPLTLNKIGRAAGLSPNHLLRSYRHVFGTTPGKHVTELRLAEAARLLAVGSSVTETCLRVGFESVGSFSALYKRRFGRPPSGEFRSDTSPSAPADPFR